MKMSIYFGDTEEAESKDLVKNKMKRGEGMINTGSEVLSLDDWTSDGAMYRTGKHKREKEHREQELMGPVRSRSARSELWCGLRRSALSDPQDRRWKERIKRT